MGALGGAGPGLSWLAENQMKGEQVSVKTEACACVWTQQLKRLELKAPPLAAPSACSPPSPREYRQSQPGQGHVGAQPGDGHGAPQDLHRQ